MRVLTIVHQADAGPGVFAEALAAGGHEVDEWRPDLGGGPPAGDEHAATLVFGGAMHVDQEERHPWLRSEKAFLARLVERGAPVLGVCLGAQLVAEAAGGRARPAAEPEIGWHELALEPEAAGDPLLAPLEPVATAFQWHHYEIEPPPDATVLARSDCCLQAFCAGERAWGIQFHAEVTAQTVAGWAEDDGEERELRRAALDPATLRAQTEHWIGSSRRLGIGLCERFLAAAAEAHEQRRRRAPGAWPARR